MKNITGRRVRLNRRTRRQVGRDHWNEFGRTRVTGTVLGPVEFPEGNFWPELDVLWDAHKPGGCRLKYCYRREQLDVLPDESKEG